MTLSNGPARRTARTPLSPRRSSSHADVPDADAIGRALASDEPAFSFEFFPPKSDEGERRLWTAIRELEPLRPTFVSVTYGAGGSTRDRTVRITERIALETTLTPVGHLTCVGQSREELRGVVGQYAAAGVRNILTLRGDPAGGPGTPWESHPGGLDSGVELVDLVRPLGRFHIGVAAYPRGHRDAASLDADARTLVAKAEAGASFAVSDFFFEADDYVRLVERVRALGCTIPIVPGIMPITNLRQITRMSELSGHPVPDAITTRIAPYEDDAAGVRAEGIVLATELCERLLDAGAPGLHFYTLNRSTATREIFERLTLSRV
ncbi:methylenetetrahydrofolate reductase [NAD(P)H] [Solicola gregarius]|uniref:Methylenetetrahydrofolate reductase n=1 Tax=Solicola gregarius TaxID=2908642 RepID=A0AA46TIC5_9ACTN|nr:methylenetetrahydrofolate reductase [NAD(P)H] [Solicola gregarius]UYM05372.1 methylenetetrahydrofolate reductase [NAD(P)H] [Solicola gregarius]